MDCNNGDMRRRTTHKTCCLKRVRGGDMEDEKDDYATEAVMTVCFYRLLICTFHVLLLEKALHVRVTLHYRLRDLRHCIRICQRFTSLLTSPLPHYISRKPKAHLCSVATRFIDNIENTTLSQHSWINLLNLIVQMKQNIYLIVSTF